MKFAVKRVICAALALLMMLSFVACAQDVPDQTAPVTEIVTEPATVQTTETPTEPAPSHAQGCGAYLLTINYPMEFGPAQYSAEEIRAMKDYSAEELQAAISTIADMVQYVVENDYGDNPNFIGDITFESGGYWWSVNKSPQGALISQSNSCGAISNLARYVLEDDYDEEGYIGLRAADGGHVFNYFTKNGVVLPCEFTLAIVGDMKRVFLPCLENIEEISSYLLQVSYDNYHAIFVERDVHRDHAPRGSANKNGKLVSFLDYSARDEIELLYFQKDWMMGEGSQIYDYHPYFENIGVSNEIVPKELVDSADMNRYPNEVEPKPLPHDEISSDPLVIGDCNINATTSNRFYYDLDCDGCEEVYIFGIALAGSQKMEPLVVDRHVVTLGSKDNFINRTVYPCVWRVEDDGTLSVVGEFSSLLKDVRLTFNRITENGKGPTTKAVSHVWPGCTEVTFGPFLREGGMWQYEFSAKLGDQVLKATATTQIQAG